MTRDEILSHPCRVLAAEQREHCFEHGVRSRSNRCWKAHGFGVCAERSPSSSSAARA